MISRALSAERLGFRAKVLAVVLAVLGIGLTVAHVSHFRSARALWEHELAINPSNLSALETLAEISSTEGDYRDAFLLCQRGYEEAFRMRVGGRGIRFALCQTRALLALTPDGDADTLNMIREVYDRLFATGMLEANADVLRFRVGVRPDQQPALLADPETLLLPRARAHLRTGHYESALSQLDAIRKAFPDHPAAQQLRDDARNLVKRSGSQPREP